ncbi:Oidioi.mRNA.OKI2018_I69.XSR.g13591.t1.cds [Oikopleura dioica]|uniref:Oidioi.mRNA.OKI2018_I69.XSR.g13591.t1.cds n=1 Tax=Oikopleura dioica TaxID=34765 RepID=A0ABN7S7B8_OIKDI|nr:Oidioi.mRNA.OKI2018_I69.XSR.g13591.t1.cds [Oikopleura dioica]
MKFLASVISSAFASHYRAGSYQYAAGTGEMSVTRTMAWRRSMDGYGSGCTQNDVDNQVESAQMIAEQVHSYPDGTLLIDAANNGTSGTYVVSEIETAASLDVNSHYCFGSIDEEFSITQPFTQTSSGCCTISMQDDDGNSFNGNYIFTSTVADVSNNSPRFNIPAVWYIMTGCSDQSLYLYPVDPDGDSIKCRWATMAEGGALARDNGRFDSLVLDADLCKVTYDPLQDTFASGIKPIAIQVEDFDADGNLRSSMPAQFMATVWTPGMPTSKKEKRLMEQSGFQLFTGLFGDNEEDHHDDFHSRGRRQVSDPSSEPAHCEGLPTFTGDSPKNGEVYSFYGSWSMSWYSEYSTGFGTFVDMDRIMFNGPAGMTCTTVDTSTGQSDCTWTPTADQFGKEHDLCAIAYDPIGRNSERVCIKLIAQAAKVNANWWLSAWASGFASFFGAGGVSGDAAAATASALWNYGCTGRGELEPFRKNAGKIVDDVDLAINAWKKCARCSVDIFQPGSLISSLWEYPEPTSFVCDASSPFEKAICECDKALANVLGTIGAPDVNFMDYDESLCAPTSSSTIDHTPMCCLTDLGSFQMYSIPSEVCCESNQLRPAGTCSIEEGIAYSRTIPFY